MISNLSFIRKYVKEPKNEICTVINEKKPLCLKFDFESNIRASKVLTH